MDDTNPQTIQAIQNALGSKDVTKLREIAFGPGGFQNNELRRQVWPMLMGLDRRPQPPTSFRTYIQEISDAEFTNQTDFYKNFEGLPNHDTQMNEIPKDANRTSQINKILLAKIITAILKKNTHLIYYQGYHDIVSVFMYVMLPPPNDSENDVQLCFEVLEKATLFYLRDFMFRNLDNVQHLSKLLPVLINVLDPQILNKLIDNDLNELQYGGIHLTNWYSHTDVEKHHNIRDVYARRFDAFLSVRSPMFPLYFAAVYLVSKKDEILLTDNDQLIQLILTLQTNPSTYEDNLLLCTLQLFNEFPPRRLVTYDTDVMTDIQQQNITIAPKQTQWDTQSIIRISSDLISSILYLGKHHQQINTATEVILLGVVAVLLGVVSTTFAN